MVVKTLDNMVGPLILLVLGATLIIINHFGQIPDRCEARMTSTPVAPVYPYSTLIGETVLEDTLNTAIREYTYEVTASSADLSTFFGSQPGGSCFRAGGRITCIGYTHPFGDYEVRYLANQPGVTSYRMVVMWDRWFCRDDLPDWEMHPFSVERRDPTDDNLVIALSNLCGMLVVLSAAIWALVHWYRGRKTHDRSGHHP